MQRPDSIPLVLYAADAPWSAYTNETFLTTNYNNEQMSAIFNNTFDLYSYGNNSVDSEWSGCMACGFILRSLQRMNMNVPEFCAGCFQRHCWNETYNSILSNDFFQPSLVLNASLSFVEFASSPVGAGLPSTGNSSASSASSPSTGGSSTSSSASPSASALGLPTGGGQGPGANPSAGGSGSSSPMSGGVHVGVNLALAIAMAVLVMIVEN